MNDPWKGQTWPSPEQVPNEVRIWDFEHRNPDGVPAPSGWVLASRFPLVRADRVAP